MLRCLPERLWCVEKGRKSDNDESDNTVPQVPLSSLKIICTDTQNGVRVTKYVVKAAASAVATDADRKKAVAECRHDLAADDTNNRRLVGHKRSAAHTHTAEEHTANNQEHPSNCSLRLQQA